MKMSPLQKNRTYYSARSAEKVVMSFLGKHARATIYFAKLVNVPYFKVIMKMQNYFRYDQKRWYAIKKTIKTVEINESMVMSRELIVNYLTSEKQNFLKEMIKAENLSNSEKLILDIDRVFDIQFVCQR